MIAYLKGIVLEKGKEHVILLCNEVGYLVQLPMHLIASVEKGGEARFYIHHIVREDASDLMGFATVDELDFFLKLISVSGVGPKMGLHLMSLGPVGSIRAAVEKGDVSFLEGAQGVGRKSAQRVILELKGKLVTDDEPGGGNDEAVSALENMGYPRAKVREAVGAVGEGTTEDRVRAALKVLSR